MKKNMIAYALSMVVIMYSNAFVLSRRGVRLPIAHPDKTAQNNGEL
jgi:hypothetical protein